MELTEKEFSTISGIIADHGYVEWNLIAFTADREYNIFSYFTDPSIMPIFRVILFSMLKRLDAYCLGQGKETTH